MTDASSTMDYQTFISQLPLKDPFSFDPSSFEILSTIRYDPGLTDKKPQTIEDITVNNFFVFTEHVERLKYTVKYFHSASVDVTESSFPFEIEENYIFNVIVGAIRDAGVALSQPLRIRLLLSLSGNLRVELYETLPRPNLVDGLNDEYPEELRYDIYVDRTPVLPSPFTSFKTTSRDVYNEARERSLPGKSKREEVLLINSCGEVMEGSITNIAIKTDTGEWVTPQLTSGCLCGVTRHFLLQKNALKEGTVHLKELEVGQDVLLLNGVLGVVRGTIREFV